MAEKNETKSQPKRKTALKRDIQNVKKRLENRIFKSQVRTAMRRFEEAVAKNEAGQVQETLASVYSLMDKGVKKGVFKINKASRTKSRLTAKAATAK